MVDCGLLNLGVCLPQKFFEFVIGILNSPISVLLDVILDLLSGQVNLALFFSLWVIIIYVLSMFYALLLIGTGFNFIISGYDAAKRENAKSWLRNIVIMIILIQASYFIYQLVIDLSIILTTATLTLVDPNFFLISANQISDLGLAILFSLLYLLSLVLTTIILVIRYAFVSLGVVLLPIGIFFYFISPLKQYGSLILNLLGVAIFVTFFDALILITFSKFANVGIYGNFKIILLITAFVSICVINLFLMFFSTIKASVSLFLDFKKITGVL